MFVFKPAGRKKFYYRFRHPLTGKLVTRAGYTDRDATVQLGARKEREAARELEGIRPSEHLRTPVLEHVTAFVDHLAAKGDSAKHGQMRAAHVKAVVLGLGWTTLAQLNGTAVEKLLAEWRAGGGRFGSRTSNHYLRSLKHWSRWLVRDGRLAADPFAHVQGVNADADPRHVRRVLDAPEFARLLAATRASTRTYATLTGPQRAVLYLTAGRTGLRANELASMTPASFDLGADPPVWSITAAADKAGRGDLLPLFPELAAELRAYLPGVPAGTPLWPGPWATTFQAAKMLRGDLAEAGIPYRTDDGVYDFHAFRATFITDMARAGVPLQAAQRLARHCDPRLTSSIYTRLGRTDLAGELNKMVTLLPPG
jgi:integrase